MAHDNRAYEDADIVKLNVGGRLFTTTAGTLRKAPYFETLLSGRFAQTWLDGHLFIDRDGKRFECVLQVLRGGRIPDDVAGLDDELDFFGVVIVVAAEPSPPTPMFGDSLRAHVASPHAAAVQRFVSSLVQVPECKQSIARQLMHGPSVAVEMTAHARATWGEVDGFEYGYYKGDVRVPVWDMCQVFIGEYADMAACASTKGTFTHNARCMYVRISNSTHNTCKCDSVQRATATTSTLDRARDGDGYSWTVNHLVAADHMPLLATVVRDTLGLVLSTFTVTFERRHARPSDNTAGCYVCAISCKLYLELGK